MSTTEYVIAAKQDLIDIADIIREKSGETGEMTLEMLKQVGAAIEAGGAKIATGTFTPVVNIEIPNSPPYAFEHNSGFIPRIFAIWTTSVSVNYATLCSVIIINEAPLSIGCRYSLLASVGRTTSSSGRDAYFSANNPDSYGRTTYITPDNCSAVYAPIFRSRASTGDSDTSLLQAEKTYFWLAISDWEGKF